MLHIYGIFGIFFVHMVVATHSLMSDTSYGKFLLKFHLMPGKYLGKEFSEQLYCTCFWQIFPSSLLLYGATWYLLIKQ